MRWERARRRLRRARRRLRRRRGRSCSSARWGTSTKASRSPSAAAGGATRATAGSFRRPAYACSSPSASTRCAPTSRASSTSARSAASRLVERFGADEVLAAIDRDPEGVLRPVPGIGPQRVGAAVASWRDQRELRELRLFLDTHGVDAASAGRIARHFGAGSLDRLQREPYAICELDGIGFATADALARALDTPLDAPDRLAGRRHARAAPRRDRRPLPPPPRRADERAAAAARRRPHRPRDRRARRAREGRRRRRARRRRAPARGRGAPRARTSARCFSPSRRCACGAEAAGDRHVRPLRRPVARRHAGARAPAVDPHRRARHGQERDDARARRARQGAHRRRRGCAHRRARPRAG